MFSESVKGLWISISGFESLGGSQSFLALTLPSDLPATAVNFCRRGVAFVDKRPHHSHFRIEAGWLTVGIMIVSVRDAENYVLHALEADADDSANKPVRFAEAGNAP